MIPTYGEFVAKVSDDRGHLGPNLVRVTESLLRYWEQTTHGTVEDEIVLLKDLYEESRNWIKKKEKKSEFQKTFLGTETTLYNQKFIGRRMHVAILAEETLKTLMDLLDREGLLTPEGRGQIKFDIRKFSQKAKTRGQRNQLKGLSKGYQLERESWLRSGKTVAISGTSLHMRLEGEDLTKQQKRAVEKIRSGKESLELWKILVDVEQSVKGRGSVIYLKKKQRFQFMVSIENGKLTDYEGKLIVWTMKDDAIFTMDQYGNLFVYSHLNLNNQIGGGDPLRFAMVNHSTMNSGRDVICAGTMKIKDGQLMEITNLSGHYKPTSKNLYECLVILQGDGLDLSQAQVAVMGPQTEPGKAPLDHFTCQTFMKQRGNGPPDLGSREIRV